MGSGEASLFLSASCGNQKLEARWVFYERGEQDRAQPPPGSASSLAVLHSQVTPRRVEQERGRR